MCEFERKLAYELDDFLQIQSTDPRNHVHPALHRKDKPGRPRTRCGRDPTVGSVSRRTRSTTTRNGPLPVESEPLSFLHQSSASEGIPRPDFTNPKMAPVDVRPCGRDGSELALFTDSLSTCARISTSVSC